MNTLFHMGKQYQQRKYKVFIHVPLTAKQLHFGTITFCQSTGNFQDWFLFIFHDDISVH